MKNNYFDNDKPKKKFAQKRKKKKGQMSAGKWIVLIISLIVAALAAFLITIKILVPDYDLTDLLPDKAQTFIKEDVLGHTTTTEPETSAPTTSPKPTRAVLDYLEDSEFKFSASKQGNFIGNLLNGGKVGNDGSYIYHIVDGKGIYRFAPSSESFSLIYKTDHVLSSLNLRGDYLYFVDETNGCLQKLQKGTQKPKNIGEDVKFVYVYDSTVYYITNENTLCMMDAKELVPETLYNSADNEMQFVGISKQKVFFSVKEMGDVEFLCVDKKADAKAAAFETQQAGELKQVLVLENGYFYYYKENSPADYSLMRRKFGSEKTFELAKLDYPAGYPITDSNKVFFADAHDGSYIELREYNMNSKKTKTMLKSDKLGEEINEAGFFHGGEYDFIIAGNDYRASSNLTSSTNVMKFKDSNWKY